MDFGSGDLLRAFGAFATGAGAFLMGWAAMRRSKQEGRKECEEEHEVAVPNPGP